jgi:hypothetical protein
MNKLIFAARTREALKSYAQLNNLNPNNYVLVEVPEALRQNKVVKSLAQNITNPDVKYVMVHKSCVTVTHNGKPALNVTALSENSYASSLNKPEAEQLGEKTVGKGGTLKSLVADIYNSNMSNDEKMSALQELKSFVNQKKFESVQKSALNAVTDIENSNLGTQEKLAALKSLEVFFKQPKKQEVTVHTALKSMLSDVNQSNLPLQLKNFIFSVIKSYANRSEPISRKDEFVTRTGTKTMGTDMNAPMPTTMSMKDKKKKKTMHAEGEEGGEVTKSLGSLGSKVLPKRDLEAENKQLLKSLGSLSEDEGLFNNMHMARRYARLFNEKIASPNQRAEVASPSVKDVQRFGKRVKARVNLV